MFKSYSQKVFGLIFFAACMKMIAAPFLELGNDEVYYWTYALQLDFNHFDHPPLVGFLIRAATLNMHWVSELSMRLGAIISASVGCYFVFKTTLVLSSERAGFFAAVLYQAGVYTGFIAGFFILPESLSLDKRRKFEWKKANPLGSLLHLKKYPAVAGLVLSLTLIYMAIHAVQSTWSYYTMKKFDWNPAMIGYSLAFVGLMIAFVQGFLIRIAIPKLGQTRSLFIGLMLYTIGMFLFSLAASTWMMFAFSAIYCLGGISGPALQGIISGHVPANEQGQLQGALTSLMSATSIVGPPLMTGLFAFFSKDGTPYFFPGAPFLAGALLFLITTILTYNSLQAEKKAALE